MLVVLRSLSSCSMVYGCLRHSGSVVVAADIYLSTLYLFAGSVALWLCGR